MRRSEGGILVICAFTGHRPQRLPWGNREEDPRCAALKQQMEAVLEQVVDRGCTTFLCGMARGCDTYFAEAVLRRGLSLEAVLPCPEQADLWSEADRLRYRKLLLNCSAIHVLEDAYSEGCMLRRNRSMVEMADLLITVYDGTGGGTGSTVDYAKQQGLEIIPVWL